MEKNHKKTILLVEDQAIIAIAETNLLKKNGYEVIGAHNGNEAVKIARDNPTIDLILMDIDLGKGIDGGEAARIILRDRDIPIVFLSNHTEKEIVDKTEKITSYGYVLKDVGETVLIASIKMAFKLYEANQKIKNELTERKRAEKAQRVSDEKYKRIVEDTRALLFNVDNKGRFTYINETTASTVGYSKEELIGRFYLKFVHPQDRKLVHEIFSKQLSGAMQSANVEFRYIKKNDTFGWLSFLTNQIYQDNQVIGLTGVAQEITARIQMGNELRENEERYRSIVENLNQAYFEADRRGVFTYCNPGLILISGYSEKELLGTISFNLVAEENRKEIVALYKQSLSRKEKSISTEFKVQTKNGQKFWVEQVTHFNFDENGVFNNATNVIKNIDERKQAEEALRESEKRYKAVSELTSDYAYAFRVEPNGTLVNEWVTDGLIRLTGYSLDELRALGGWEHLIHTEDLQVAHRQFESLISNKSATAEYRIITRTQQIRWMRDYARPVWSAIEKRVTSIEGAVQDITEQKWAEEALRNNENKINSIFRVAPIGIGVTSNRVLIELNEYIFKMLGYSPLELIGQSAQILYPTQEEFEFVGKEKYRQIEQFGTGSVETKWKCKDGRLIDVLLNSTPLNLKEISGGVTFTALDITQRKLTEELIKESEANLNSMINNRFESIWSIDKYYNYIITNNFFKEAYLRTFGIELKKGMNALNILTPELKEFWKSKYEKALDGENVIFEITNLVENELHYYEVSLDPIISDDKIIGVSGISVDITARKQAEQFLKNAATEKVTLHRELLHRIKNSLNLIKSLVFLERDKVNDKDTSKILENLEMRISTLSHLYSLLNESGISQEVDLGEYLNQITESLKKSYFDENKKIIINSSFSKVSVSPKTASAVGLIVNEILTNSLKYAFPHTLKGNVSLIMKESEGNANIEISDNGIGASELLNIKESKGLGLQLVNMLVQQLSGTLKLETKGGTKFKIIFPLSD